jgi:hypothetical protein
VIVMRRVSLLPKLLAGSIGLYFVLPASGQFASDLLSGRFKAQGVVTAFYEGAEQTPSMVVRADAIYTDYERKGFFRIGLLPVGIMEGVTFELHHPESFTNSLAQMRGWLGSQAAKRMEFRKVSFLTFAGETNRLESGRARFSSGGRWELLDGVRLLSGTNQVAAPHATLQVAGKQTGQLVMATDPPCTNNLFVRTEFPTTNQKEAP